MYYLFNTYNTSIHAIPKFFLKMRLRNFKCLICITGNGSI